MVSRFLHKLVIPMIKLLEGIMTILELFVFCAHTVLLIMAIRGVPYQVQDTRPMYWRYMILWGLASIGFLLTLIQWIIIKVTKPHLSRLELIMSPEKARNRVAWRYYLESFYWTFFVFIAYGFYRKWLGDDFPGGWWGKFVSTMNLQIPITVIVANLIHVKLWAKIGKIG